MFETDQKTHFSHDWIVGCSAVELAPAVAYREVRGRAKQEARAVLSRGVTMLIGRRVTGD